MDGNQSPPGGYESARAYFRAGNLARCIEILEQYLPSHPDDAASLTLKGTALLELDDPAAAIEALRAATRAAPDDAEAWLQTGVALVTEGQLGEAAEAFRAAARLEGHNVRALVDLGNVLFSLNRTDEALEALEQASRLQPGDLSILWNLAGMYVSADRPGAALAQIQKILDFNPGDMAAQCDAAWLLFEQGRLSEAAEMFKAIRRAEPDRDHELFALHGLVMIEMGREDWRRALAFAIEATKLDRYDFTTALLSYISGKVFDQESDVDADQLLARFESEYRELRALHV